MLKVMEQKEKKNEHHLRKSSCEKKKKGITHRLRRLLHSRRFSSRHPNTKHSRTNDGSRGRKSIIHFFFSSRVFRGSQKRGKENQSSPAALFSFSSFFFQGIESNNIVVLS